MARSLADKYLLALRLIQPARVQDITKKVFEVWPESRNEAGSATIGEIHQMMRDAGNLVSVRRGTYVLTREGMEIVAGLRKERDMDNARLFLMKDQRKRYHRVARRLG